jgi:hypothetical protein
MGTQTVAMHAFNRGIVGKRSLGRVDVDRLRLSAEDQTNWQPAGLGPMSLRPGLEYIGNVLYDQPARLVPFVFAADDTALLELTSGVMRVWVGGEDLITRTSVSATIPGFGSGSWTSTVTGSGYVSLTSSGLAFYNVTTGSAAVASATLTINELAVEHAIRIYVARGPVKLRIGTTAGTDDVVVTTSIDTGYHSITFRPQVGTVYLQFESSDLPYRYVTVCSMETAGVMEIPHAWTVTDLPHLRWAQSGDVLFVACPNKQQYRIERRGTRAWSVVRYRFDDGPFGAAGDSSISITPTGIKGDIYLISNRPLFESGHDGALFRLFHTGQYITAALAAADTYSDTIRVSGVSQVYNGTVNVATQDRNFVIGISGTWSGTLTLQRSLEGEDSGFTDYATYTANTAGVTINDGLNNIIAWYRIGFKGGNYTSGTADVAFYYGGGGGSGVVRVTGFISATQVYAEVLSPLLNTSSTKDWRESEWSGVQGWPTAVAFHEGRLWWAGADRIWGSVSDAYTSFDYEMGGDAAPVQRSIGEGPIANINWLCSLTRLILGADTSCIAARSSSFDEPLTPTNFNLKSTMTEGTAGLPVVKVDTRALFVQQSGRRIHELAYDVTISDYKRRDMTRLNPDIGVPGFVDLAVQRQPDTNVHLVRTDGKVAALLYDVEDEVEAWWLIETDGVVENVCSLPGVLEDEVYYVVRRTINGVQKRYIERMARQDECVGAPMTKLVDSFACYTGNETRVMTGLSHLEGKLVAVWGNSKDLGTYTVSGGSITLSEAVTTACIGLPYTATFKSAKLAYAADAGTALNATKRISALGLIMADTHKAGVTYGDEDGYLEPLPAVENGVVTADDAVWDSYDAGMFPLPGTWGSDSRLILRAASPRPATVMAATITITTN